MNLQGQAILQSIAHGTCLPLAWEEGGERERAHALVDKLKDELVVIAGNRKGARAGGRLSSGLKRKGAALVGIAANSQRRAISVSTGAMPNRKAPPRTDGGT